MKLITIRLEKEQADMLKQMAKAENRTMKGFVLNLIEKHRKELNETETKKA